MSSNVRRYVFILSSTFTNVPTLIDLLLPNRENHTIHHLFDYNYYYQYYFKMLIAHTYLKISECFQKCMLNFSLTSFELRHTLTGICIVSLISDTLY
jgi:hypothetical protein